MQHAAVEENVSGAGEAAGALARAFDLLAKKLREMARNGGILRIRQFGNSALEQCRRLAPLAGISAALATARAVMESSWQAE